MRELFSRTTSKWCLLLVHLINSVEISHEFWRHLIAIILRSIFTWLKIKKTSRRLKRKNYRRRLFIVSYNCCSTNLISARITESFLKQHHLGSSLKMYDIYRLASWKFFMHQWIRQQNPATLPCPVDIIQTSHAGTVAHVAGNITISLSLF